MKLKNGKHGRSEAAEVPTDLNADAVVKISNTLRPLLAQNPARTIYSLTADEINVVSVNAISAYILSRQRADQRFAISTELNDPISDLFLA